MLSGSGSIDTSMYNEADRSKMKENKDSTKREKKYRLLRKNNYEISDDLDKIMVECMRHRIYSN